GGRRFESSSAHLAPRVHQEEPPSGRDAGLSSLRACTGACRSLPRRHLLHWRAVAEAGDSEYAPGVNRWLTWKPCGTVRLTSWPRPSSVCFQALGWGSARPSRTVSTTISTSPSD